MTRSDDARSLRAFILVAALVVIAAAGRAGATSCGSGTYPFPYTDVAGVGDSFCPGIMEAYVLGVTKGTTPTTFAPNQDVTRVQMTTFLQRALDQGLKRSHRRAALGQWWTPRGLDALQFVTLPSGGPLGFCKSDGERVWVANGRVIQSIHPASGDVEADIFLTTTIDAALSLVVANGVIVATDASAQRLVLATMKRTAPFFHNLYFPFVRYRPNTLTFDVSASGQRTTWMGRSEFCQSTAAFRWRRERSSADS